MTSRFGFYIRWATSTWFGLKHQERYCREWDRALNRLLDSHWDGAEIDKGECTLSLGVVKVWVWGAFFSYGHALLTDLPKRRPSVATMGRIDELVSSLKQKRRDAKRAEYLRRLARLG